MRIEIKNQELTRKVLNKLLSKEFNQELNGISIDSRNIEKNDIFIAIQGENNHGIDFINKKLLNEISLVITDQIFNSSKVYAVDDSRKFLKNFAMEFRNNLAAKIIGITGTNGKTSTKELLVQFLKTKYSVDYSKGNYNSTISLPLSILECDNASEYCVLEMGASKHGEINLLCETSSPDFGLITNISEAHLEGFEDFEDLINTKLDLYKSVNSNKGIYFLNKDDKNIQINQDSQCDIISFSFKDLNSDYYADISKIGEGIIYINQHLFNIPYRTETFASNFLASYSIASSIGINADQIQRVLDGFVIPEGRGNIIHINNMKIINDTYNANFESMYKGIAQLDLFNKDDIKIALILGDMLELSKDTVRIHEELGKYINRLDFINSVFGIGEFIQHTINAIDNSAISKSYFPDKKTFIENFKTEEINNYNVVYLKGSRSMELEKIIEELF